MCRRPTQTQRICAMGRYEVLLRLSVPENPGIQKPADPNPNALNRMSSMSFGGGKLDYSNAGALSTQSCIACKLED